jgi:hypothetical protein
MALPCLAATDLETPIPHAGLLAAFQGAAQALIGHTVAVTWSWQGDRSARVEWHGRILNITNASVRIFYWKQGGMPELKRGAPGIEVEMPRANVEYWRVQVTAPVAVSAAELEDAMRTPPQQHEQISMDSWIFHQVQSWSSLADPSGAGAEITKNRIALLAQVSLTSSAKRREALDLVFAWVDSVKGIDSWLESEPLVRLGNSLVRHLRVVVAEEANGVSSDQIARQLAREDETDPVGQAIARLSAEKKKPALRFCTFCRKRGHTEPYCNLKNASKNEKGSDKNKKH